MKRYLLRAGAAVACAVMPLAGSAGSATAAAAGAAQLPRAELRGFACTLALDPTSRAVAVTAVMRPISGTRHMQLRFVLDSRSAGGVPTPIHAGDLGRWINPTNPTLGQLPGDVWNLQKEVVPLAAPAAYRFLVRFRWLGLHGRVLATALRVSRICHQRELRPDLQVRSITVAAIPNQPSRDLYTALLANAGNTGAGPFSVLFAPADGSGDATKTVSFLAAHKVRTLSFVGPVCTSASVPTIIADSASQIDDYNRANNSLTATCPASTG